jgi:hypothetical protein
VAAQRERFYLPADLNENEKGSNKMNELADGLTLRNSRPSDNRSRFYPAGKQRLNPISQKNGF